MVSSVTVVPETVHTEVVVDENDTVNPDEEVALTVRGDCASVTSGNAPKVIVCAFFDTVKLRRTVGAALNEPLPA